MWKVLDRECWLWHLRRICLYIRCKYTTIFVVSWIDADSLWKICVEACSVELVIDANDGLGTDANDGPGIDANCGSNLILYSFWNKWSISAMSKKKKRERSEAFLFFIWDFFEKSVLLNLKKKVYVIVNIYELAKYKQSLHSLSKKKKAIPSLVLDALFIRRLH